MYTLYVREKSRFHKRPKRAYTARDTCLSSNLSSKWVLIYIFVTYVKLTSSISSRVSLDFSLPHHLGVQLYTKVG